MYTGLQWEFSKRSKSVGFWYCFGTVAAAVAALPIVVGEDSDVNAASFFAGVAVASLPPPSPSI